jgi:hypothetical protein
MQAALIAETVFGCIKLTVQTLWMRVAQQGALKEAGLYAGTPAASGRSVIQYALVLQSGQRAGEALRLTLVRTKSHGFGRRNTAEPRLT